jgi:hypothetical protein
MVWHVSPAYGRDYKSRAEAVSDWEAGKDFVLEGLHGGTYCNIEGARQSRVSAVNIRYKRKTQVAVVSVKAAVPA